MALMVDIDRFKKLNDEMGHLAGDDALRKFASRLHDAVRVTDVVVRYGGEEFLILAEVDERGAEVIMRKMFALNKVPLDVDSSEVSLTSSIGVASLHDIDGAQTGDVDTLKKQLIANADNALLQAKQLGRNRGVFHANEKVCTPDDPEQDLFEILSQDRKKDEIMKELKRIIAGSSFDAELLIEAIFDCHQLEQEEKVMLIEICRYSQSA